MADAGDGRGVGGWLRRGWPVLVLLGLAGAFFGFGLQRHLGWDGLMALRADMEALRRTRPALAAALFVAAYGVGTAMLLPRTVFNLLGGLLFGAWLGTALSVAGATLGGAAMFLAARSLAAPILRRFGGRGTRLSAVREELRRGGALYLLTLKLLPGMPGWIGNTAPALSGMRLPVFAATAALGITPVTAVFCWIGTGLEEEIDAHGGAPSAADLLSARTLAPLLVLAALALAAAWWRRRSARGSGGAARIALPVEK